MDWREQAACQHADPEIFWPAGRPRRPTHTVATALAICARCPVTGPCREWAVGVTVAENMVAGGVLWYAGHPVPVGTTA